MMSEIMFAFVMWLLISVTAIVGQLDFGLAFSDTCSDPCDSNPCLNNSTCLTGFSCQPICSCADGFSGVKCEFNSDNINDKTIQKNYLKMSDSFCHDVGLFCVFGSCSMLADAKFTCNCSTGWTGAHCNVSAFNDTISLQTDDVRTDDIQNMISTTAVSVLPTTTSGQSRQLLFKLESWGNFGQFDVTTPSPESHPLVSLEERVLDTKFNVCSDMPWERPMSERRCPIQAHTEACVHGVCKKEVKDHGSWSGHVFTCVCDIGALGIHCEYKCCLDCGENGRCIREADGHNICSCEDGYSGARCELDVTRSSSGPQSSLSLEERVFDSKYNVCSDKHWERPMSDRKCPMQPRTQACVYGLCKEEVKDHGTWKGHVFTCMCDIGARGTHCEHKCCRDCGENGRCNVRETDGQVCDCKAKYTGDNCELLIPDPVSIVEKEVTWYLWVVGVCVGAFVLLLVIAIVAPYMMWKHRVILIMKIVHYFQPYEDDDEKQWDAFVSYKSHPTDEHFVVHELYPKLEKELGFKLCLHFRDFVPGETISNNIINAVEGSRRTILILTPRYIESEFTRFEYQKAQEEMLKRKHRIIPIVLEDISDTKSIMDKNLKGIVDSVTYLEWPGTGDELSKKVDKFWKRLQLSLPKKKISESSESCISDSSQSTYVSNITSSTTLPPITPLRLKQDITNCSKSTDNIRHSKENIYMYEDDEEIYDEIVNIDETLSVPVESLSEDNNTYDMANEKTDKNECYDYSVIPRDENCGKYVDPETEGRYIEFRTDENNRPFMDILNPGYIEFEI